MLLLFIYWEDIIYLIVFDKLLLILPEVNIIFILPNLSKCYIHCIWSFSDISVNFIFLKGATPVDPATIPEDVEQIFMMSDSISDTQKEDMAWATYVLLRNTSTISVVMLHVIGNASINHTNDGDPLTRNHVIYLFSRIRPLFGKS